MKCAESRDDCVLSRNRSIAPPFQRCQALSVSYQTIPARHPHLYGDSLGVCSYVCIDRPETQWANRFVLQTTTILVLGILFHSSSNLFLSTDCSVAAGPPSVLFWGSSSNLRGRFVISSKRNPDHVPQEHSAM